MRSANLKPCLDPEEVDFSRSPNLTGPACCGAGRKEDLPLCNKMACRGRDLPNREEEAQKLRQGAAVAAAAVVVAVALQDEEDEGEAEGKVANARGRGRDDDDDEAAGEEPEKGQCHDEEHDEDDDDDDDPTVAVVDVVEGQREEGPGPLHKGEHDDDAEAEAEADADEDGMVPLAADPTFRLSIGVGVEAPGRQAFTTIFMRRRGPVAARESCDSVI
mmetsp:Transcript_32966/g.70708  ORF Transcript_32966/g.70708 Transcript_32966/m.70708 type:complete len:218 (+) Transcript_32966:1143-1796(+)